MNDDVRDVQSCVWELRFQSCVCVSRVMNRQSVCGSTQTGGCRFWVIKSIQMNEE